MSNRFNFMRAWFEGGVLAKYQKAASTGEIGDLAAAMGDQFIQEHTRGRILDRSEDLGNLFEQREADLQYNLERSSRRAEFNDLGNSIIQQAVNDLKVESDPSPMSGLRRKFSNSRIRSR